MPGLQVDMSKPCSVVQIWWLILALIETIVYGALESIAVLWRLRSYRDIIIIIIM